MSPIIRGWKAFDGAIAKVETVIAVVALALILVFTFTPIVVRTIGANASSISWTGPLSLYLLLTSTFFGASLAVRARRHIQIDLVTRGLPARGKAAFGVVGGIIAALIMGLLCYAAVHYVQVNWQQASKLRDLALGSHHVRDVPLGPIQLAMPIALGIMTMRFLLGALEDLNGAVTGDLEYRKAFDHGEAGHVLAEAQEVGAPPAPTEAVEPSKDGGPPAGTPDAPGAGGGPSAGNPDRPDKATDKAEGAA